MEQTTSRGQFLRRVGVTLAAGIGVAAFPGEARAYVNCCPSSCNPGTQCPTGQQPFYCNCGGGGQDYCVCHDCGDCYNGPC
jgi:hypothetical protein